MIILVCKLTKNDILLQYHYFWVTVLAVIHRSSMPSLNFLFDIVDYIPDLTQLPSFVLRLASDVEWNVEKDCFDTICRVMARFYRKPNNPEVRFSIGYCSLKPFS